MRENDVNPDGTLKPASAFKRKKVVSHRSSKGLAAYNPRLAAWLRTTPDPLVKVLAQDVPDGERYEVERDLTRQLRQGADLLNIKDGTRHTPESIARIRAGRERARAKRAAALELPVPCGHRIPSGTGTSPPMAFSSQRSGGMRSAPVRLVAYRG
ncbi:MAG TPA: hypothetical protein VGG16_27870 [Streptosporangiaceae bacterium]